MVLGAVFLAAGVAVTVLRLRSGSSLPGEGASPGSAPSSDIGSASSAARILANPGAPSGAPSLAASGPALRFRLRISPADAEVLVDGTVVGPAGESVELAGAAGSMHDVELRRNGSAFRTSVRITERGLVPPGIELVTPAAPSSASASRRSPVPGSGARGKPSFRLSGRPEHRALAAPHLEASRRPDARSPMSTAHHRTTHRDG